MRLHLIVAAASNGVIGRDGDLPWHLPADLRHFKSITLGHAIVMGRRTWESIGRPLPGRRNVILTRSLASAPDGTEIFRSLDHALAALANEETVFVIGGAGVFREALPRAERVYLTSVEAEVEGDVHFPTLDPERWVRTASDSRPADADHAFPYSFEVWERRV